MSSPLKRTTRPVAFFFALLALAACDSEPAGQSLTRLTPKDIRVAPGFSGTDFSVAPPNAPSGPAVDNFATAFLDRIQAQSIADRSEYCGYIFINANGGLQGTQPRRGTFASCDMPAPQPGQGIIASYHTHGAYGGDYDNEVPSVIDLVSDFEFGIDGYVSTPGGRVWLVDFQTRSTRQICGLECVTSDPGFLPRGEAGIRASYTVPTLQHRQSRY